MIVNENGKINLQSALNHLVDMGVENPNIFNEYKQNPPSWLGSNAGLLINMAANMVGDQRQRTKGVATPQSTVMDQNIAKATQPQGLAGLNPMMANEQRMAMNEVQPAQAPTQQMAEGGLAGLDTGDMYDDQSYATGGIVAFNGKDGSEVRTYPDYTPQEESTSWFDRYIGGPFGRYMDREKEMMLADDAIEKYKLEKGVGPLTKQKKSEIEAYDKGLAELEAKRKEAGKSLFYKDTKPKETAVPPLAPPTKENATETADNQVKRDKANEDALKNANDDYLNSIKMTNNNQISSYDQAMQRVMDLAKNDPYRAQLRKDYEQEKEGALFDVAGDIGQYLLGAKKGQEGEALQKGFAAAGSRVKDLRKQKRDLMLAEQKADHEYQLLGAKYGFDSEQAKAALAAKERMAEAENKAKLEYGNIVSGGRDRKLQLEARGKYDKALAEWSKGEGLMTVQYANMKPTGDKKHDAQIAQAKQVLANKIRELQLGYNLQDVGSTSNAGTKVVDFNDLYKP